MQVQRRHRHIQLSSGARTRRAAKYPHVFCDTILLGVEISQRAELELLRLGEEEAFMDDMCEADVDVDRWVGQDDITGEALDPKAVREGRAEEIDFMNKIGTWEVLTREEMREKYPSARIIGTRWVQVNKGTAAAPMIRCRLVAKVFAHEKRDDLYAGTPPLAATRYVLSDAMSRGRDSRQRRLMVLDVKKAFLHGKLERDVFIELPPEDPRSQGGAALGGC